MKQNKIKAIREKYLVYTTPELMSALKELRAATGMSINALIHHLLVRGIHSEYSGCPEAIKLVLMHHERLLLERPEPRLKLDPKTYPPTEDDLDSY